MKRLQENSLSVSGSASEEDISVQKEGFQNHKQRRRAFQFSITGDVQSGEFEVAEHGKAHPPITAPGGYEDMPESHRRDQLREDLLNHLINLSEDEQVALILEVLPKEANERYEELIGACDNVSRVEGIIDNIAKLNLLIDRLSVNILDRLLDNVLQYRANQDRFCGF